MNTIVSHRVPDQDLEDPDDPDPEVTAKPKHSVKPKRPRGRKKKDNGSSKLTLNCRHCKKTFTKLTQLRNHLAVNGACTKKPFQCSLCDKGFSFEHSLSAHMLLHTGNSSDKCGGI